jgi:hypothetical protein
MNVNAMAHGQMNSNNGQQPAIMYNNNNTSPMQMQQQSNGVEAMTNNYAASNNYQPCPPPPYTSNNMPTTAIQCQDVSQSQDFNRTREAANAAASVTPLVGNGAAAAAAAAASSPAAPGNMRPETYQRTLEYVQQCQTWATGDNAKATKENKPPQVGVCAPQSGPAAKMTETTTTAATAATATVTVGRALLSPGQDAVSSSTDRQEAAVAAAAALLPSASNQSSNNMVVHDMNTSLNSLMQENRFLQMIQ